MSRSRDLLQRFRPAGTPGAAAATGVPADRAAELSAELEPILARLAEAERDARALVDEARAEAERIRHEAAERARAVRAVAVREAEEERAAAATGVTERAAKQTEAALAAAERDASEVLRVAGRRIDALVDRVPVTVHDLLEEPGP